VGASFLVVRLPIRADISNLLPPTAQSVRDLKALEKRARAFGFIFVQVESDDPEFDRRRPKSCISVF